MKNLVIILSHCDTPLKIKTLKETIAALRSIEVDVLLTSHIPVGLDIQDMVDYYVFDKSNPVVSIGRKSLVMWAKYPFNEGFVLTQTTQFDHWGGVMNQIKKGADIGLSLNYDCYSFIGYDVTLEEVHLKELDNPCPTEDIVTCDWGDSRIETKKIKNFSRKEEEKIFVSSYASCDFNIIKKDCFKKIRALLSLERYLEKNSSGERFFEVAEEYWTSLVHLFKSRFVKKIEEKIQTGLNQNHLDDLFEIFISKEEEGVRNVFFFNIKEAIKFRINNDRIIELKDNKLAHLETGVKQIQYLSKDGRCISFSKEMEESDKRDQVVTFE